MSRLAIITNPQSYRNRLWPLAAQALRKAAPGAGFYEAGSVAALAAVAEEVTAAGHEVVAIAGGDGSVQHAVTALDRACGGKLPLLALLGGGAYDSLAALGGRGDAEVRLRRLSEALASGAPMSAESARAGDPEALRVVERDTLRVGGACGFRLGVGLPVVFVEAVYRAGGGRSAGLRTLVGAANSSLVNGPFARDLYRPLPVTPAADFDLALLVPRALPAGEVERVIRSAAGELLEQLVAFDVYEGTGVGDGFRSIAWRLTLRHPERTLRDKEIEGRRSRILSALQKELNVRQRST